jgi:hypothetical protein
LAEPQLPEGAPGTALFPQFESTIYSMFTTELAGLSGPQLDFESSRWEWSRWSIRRNVSHVASGNFRWLLHRWGDRLFPDGLPDVGGLEGVASPHGRMLDEGKYWALEDILKALRRGLDLCQWVLSRETVASLRSKEIKTENSAQWQMFTQAHPRGIRPDPRDPSQCYMSLEATFRHRWFEHTTHLYNIQRLKRAQGLAAKVELPFEGYWALPGWDRSEP